MMRDRRKLDDLSATALERLARTRFRKLQLCPAAAPLFAAIGV